MLEVGCTIKVSDKNIVDQEGKRKELCDFQEYFNSLLVKYSIKLVGEGPQMILTGKYFTFVLHFVLVGNVRKYILNVLSTKDNRGFQIEAFHFTKANIRADGVVL